MRIGRGDRRGKEQSSKSKRISEVMIITSFHSRALHHNLLDKCYKYVLTVCFIFLHGSRPMRGVIDAMRMPPRPSKTHAHTVFTYNVRRLLRSVQHRPTRRPNTCTYSLFGLRSPKMPLVAVVCSIHDSDSRRDFTSAHKIRTNCQQAIAGSLRMQPQLAERSVRPS